jgi:two-component system sensor histidine kinase/response regulator
VALEQLQALGFAVDTAENGSQATARVGSERYDLILMDVQMPVLDGMAATRAIRAMPGGETIPIVAMTANAFDDDRQRCLAAGMNDFVAKPVEPAVLHAILLRWLSLRPPAAKAAFAVPPPERSAAAADDGCLAVLADIPGFDVRRGLQCVGGRRETYLRLLRQFVAEQAGDAAEIDRQLAAGDAIAARRSAHSLKGAAGALGATRLQAAAGELEVAIRDRQPAPEIERLSREVEAVRSLLATGLRAAFAAEACMPRAAGDRSPGRIEREESSAAVAAEARMPDVDADGR